MGVKSGEFHGVVGLVFASVDAHEYLEVGILQFSVGAAYAHGLDERCCELRCVVGVGSGHDLIAFGCHFDCGQRCGLGDGVVLDLERVACGCGVLEDVAYGY